jgi:HTH-type transcriptional regulator/antitoxin HigA
MAYALAQRFAMEPGAFLSAAPAKPTPIEAARPMARKPAKYSARNEPSVAHLATEAGTGEYKVAASKKRKPTAKDPAKD